MKKLHVAAVLFLSVGVAIPKSSQAILIGTAMTGGASSVLYVVGGVAGGFGAPFLVADATEPFGWIWVGAGILLDGDKKVSLDRELADLAQLREQVRLGIYSEAEAGAIAGELKALDESPTKKEAKIDTQGLTSAQIVAEACRQLGVSELTAGFILSEMGVQTE